MKKKISSMVIVSLLVTSFPVKLDSMASYAEDAETFSYSYVLENAVWKNPESPELDDSLFDKFLKYSLLISDKDSLSMEEIALCRKIFETERSCIPYISCPYARETIKRGASPKRMKLDDLLDDKFMLVNMSDAFSYTVDLAAYYPDIIYNRLEDISICEYWLDDSGKERIVTAPGHGFGPYYEIISDEPIDPYEQDRIAIECNGAGQQYEMDDGTYRFVVELYGEQYEDYRIREKYVSDIWEYEIMHDGSALIVGSTLPSNDKAIPLKEPTILPTELDGRIVYGIDMDQALCQTGITKIVVPESYQFVNLSRMEHLKEIEINAPELSIENIGINSCENLESAVLNVRFIGASAFTGCDALKSVEITGAEGIDHGAFENLLSLSKVRLPDNLRYIGQNAFVDTAVKELEIPESVEIIGAAIPAYEHWNIITVPLIERSLVIADEDCVIKGYYNTETHRYTLANGHKFSPLDDIEYGDVNSDDDFNVADVVVLAKWLQGASDIQLDNWMAADFCKDGKLDVFDLCLIRRELINAS